MDYMWSLAILGAVVFIVILAAMFAVIFITVHIRHATYEFHKWNFARRRRRALKKISVPPFKG